MPDKAALFTGLGYGMVSISYRLSPMTGDPNDPDPNRIMFPDHPDDVGEAIGWLDRNALRYGLDPDRMILMGHSAGAHLASLVSTDPRYIERYGVDRRQILGAIPLDTGAFDIEQSVLGLPDEPSLLFANAFGSPAENLVTNAWETASPLTWADASDPRHLFVVQNISSRINLQLAMAIKLGQPAIVGRGRAAGPQRGQPGRRIADRHHADDPCDHRLRSRQAGAVPRTPSQGEQASSECRPAGTQGPERKAEKQERHLRLHRIGQRLRIRVPPRRRFIPGLLLAAEVLDRTRRSQLPGEAALPERKAGRDDADPVQSRGKEAVSPVRTASGIGWDPSTPVLTQT